MPSLALALSPTQSSRVSRPSRSVLEPSDLAAAVDAAVGARDGRLDLVVCNAARVSVC